MNLTSALGEFASSVRWKALPSRVQRATRWCVADFVANAIAGRDQENARAIMTACGPWRGSGRCTVIGDGPHYSAEGAAFLNSFISEVLEAGHGHADGGGHLGATTIPVALSMAEQLHLSPEEALAATVAGYEVFGRVGGAAMPRIQHQGFISTGMSGALGAAAAAARAMKAPTGEMCNALGVAAYLAPASPMSGCCGTVNSGEAAQAAWTGVLAARMGIAGIAGAEDPVADYCQRFGGLPTLRQYVSSLGEKYEILNLYFKPFPGCRFTHGVAEATLQLVQQESLGPESIESITGWVTPESLQACGHYTDADCGFVRAQFSIPYVISTLIFDGSITPRSFSKEGISRENVHRFARGHVRVESAWEGDRAPDLAAARVEIVTTDGRRRSAGIDVPKGSPANPMDEQDLARKFTTLVAPTLGSDAAATLLTQILSLDRGTPEKVGQILGCHPGRSSPAAEDR